MKSSHVLATLFPCVRTLNDLLDATAWFIIDECGGFKKAGTLFLCNEIGIAILNTGFGMYKDSREGVQKDVAKSRVSEFLSEEKCMRLIISYRTHVLSYQSKDLPKGKDQGGIRLESGFLMSIDGLGGENDEAYAMALAVASGLATDKYAIELMSISNNYDNYLRKLKILNRLVHQRK